MVVYPATRIIMSDAYDFPAVARPFRSARPPSLEQGAHRFAREFEEGLDRTLGSHGRRRASPPAQQYWHLVSSRQCDTRRKKLMAFLMKYIQDVPLQNTLRAQAHGEAPSTLGQVTEACREIKAHACPYSPLGRILAPYDRSLQAEVGAEEYRERRAARMQEHDMAVLMLKAVQNSGVLTLAGEATKEYVCDPNLVQHPQ